MCRLPYWMWRGSGFPTMLGLPTCAKLEGERGELAAIPCVLFLVKKENRVVEAASPACLCCLLSRRAAGGLRVALPHSWLAASRPDGAFVQLGVGAFPQIRMQLPLLREVAGHVRQAFCLPVPERFLTCLSCECCCAWSVFAVSCGKQEHLVPVVGRGKKKWYMRNCAHLFLISLLLGPSLLLHSLLGASQGRLRLLPLLCY